MEYKSNRIIDGKPKWVIIDENGDIVNKNPSKEKLKIFQTENYNSRFKDVQNHYQIEEQEMLIQIQINI